MVSKSEVKRYEFLILSVGCERGVHYYAMQFIEGRSLAQVIEQLRHTAGPWAAADESAGARQLTQGFAAGRSGDGNPKSVCDDLVQHDSLMRSACLGPQGALDLMNLKSEGH